MLTGRASAAVAVMAGKGPPSNVVSSFEKLPAQAGNFTKTLLARIAYKDEQPNFTAFELQAADGTLIRAVGWPKTGQQQLSVMKSGM